jgi:predicted DNA-binding protein with PD1-like motif
MPAQSKMTMVSLLVSMTKTVRDIQLKFFDKKMEKYSKITFRDSFKAANFFQIYLAHPVHTK